MGERRERLLGIPYWHRGEYGWYADFRKYSDVGGGRIKVGDTEEEAHEAIAEKRAEFISLRERRDSFDGGNPSLVDVARDHIRKKKPTVADKTIKNADRSIRYLIDFLGADARISDVTPRALSDFIEWRMAQPGYRGSKVKASTMQVELAHISSMCATAVAYGLLSANPVSRVPNKPKIDREEPVWLERGEAWRILKAAGEHQADPDSRCYPYLSEILHTFLLTGGRSKEVRGLMLDDIDLDGGRVHFRPNEIRSLKTDRAKRTVPLWPQLRAVLTQHMEAVKGPELFPAMSASGKRIVGKFSESLAEVLAAAKVDKRVTPHTFRHTYAAHRLQTTDNGAPVSVYTVMREMGHRDISLLEQLYGHLPTVRDRSAVVSFREATITYIRKAK